MSDQLLDSLRDLIAEWRKVAADPNAATEALYGDVLDACADDLEEKLRCSGVAAMWEAIIKVNPADDLNRRGRDIEEGIGYACALLMDEYGWNAANLRDTLERLADEADDREEASCRS